MIYLDLRDLIKIAKRALRAVDIRDIGLLESALARPKTTVFGQDAYPSIFLKAAALLHSLAKNHALIDGNKRLALAAAGIFLDINGIELALTNDEAYDLVMAVASGEVEDVESIAARLRPLP